MKTLHLVLKRKWFEMIASGKKTEEYREIKPYWIKRLLNINEPKSYFDNMSKSGNRPALICYLITAFACGFAKDYTHVTFQLGYQKNAPRMTFEIERISMGLGYKPWGAPDNEVFIIKLGKRV